MAEMNLLKAGFTGRLGQLSGAVVNHKYILKAGVFSKAPPTPRQTNNVRAFEALNRIAGAISKAGFQYLGLTEKNMLRHNAIAKFLKPAIKNHFFEPSLISEVIPADNSLRLVNFSANASKNSVAIALVLDTSYIPPPGSRLFFLIFNQFGQVQYIECAEARDIQKTVNVLLNSVFVFSLLAFIAELSPKGRILRGFVYKEGFNMQYSAEEQPTGDVWLDGRPIYWITLYSDTAFNIPANTGAVQKTMGAISLNLSILDINTVLFGADGSTQAFSGCNFTGSYISGSTAVINRSYDVSYSRSAGTVILAGKHANSFPAESYAQQSVTLFYLKPVS
jgi:hypothetical protein